MITFSITCLVLILLSLQHLLNWFWRKNYKDENLTVLGAILSIVSVFASYVIVYHIISWGKNLI